MKFSLVSLIPSKTELLHSTEERGRGVAGQGMFAFLDLKRKVILSPLPSRATRTRLTTVEQTGLIFYYEPINMIASTRVVTLAYSLHKTLRTLSVVAPTAAPLSISFCLFCWEVARLMPPVTSPCGRTTSCVARNVSSCTGRA